MSRAIQVLACSSVCPECPARAEILRLAKTADETVSPTSLLVDVLGEEVGTSHLNRTRLVKGLEALRKASVLAESSSNRVCPGAKLNRDPGPIVTRAIEITKILDPTYEPPAYKCGLEDGFVS